MEWLSSPAVAHTIRLLPFAVSDGPRNMAADEVLLQSAQEGVASLRFYGWPRATLSLGYFQPAQVRDAYSLLANLPFVRRCTGGKTLVHHEELTYALALPPGPDWQPHGPSWLCRMHEIIAAALKTLGVQAHSCGAGEERNFGEILCFHDQTPGDLLCQGKKVVGSAQRKQRGALLQHGAILLEQSPFTLSLPGLRELAGFEPRRVDELKTSIHSEFSRATGWRLEPSDWTETERVRQMVLAESKYGQPSWSLKR